jgi:hypothetical protein
MRRFFINFFLLLIALNVSAQVRTHLPYSIFGVGEINPKGLSRNLGMGKTGIANASGHYLNNLNPASYHDLDSISFFFDFGLGMDFVKYETSYETQHGHDINVKDIAMGYKVAKNWTGGIGIVPFSTVGYKITSQKNVEGTTDLFTADLTGNGGLTQFYMDNAYVLFHHLSLGITTSYVFGSITNSETVHYDKLASTITSTTTSHVNKVMADFGFQYFFNLNKNSRLSVGGVFGNSHDLNFKQELLITQSTGQTFEDKVTQEGTFNFPLYIGGGISFEMSNKLTVNADYMFRNWSATNENSTNTQFSYVNTNAYRLGAEYIPGRMNEYGFMGRIAYRAGFYSEDYYIEINNKSINETGFSAGFGIPFLKNKTTVNFSYNSGVRGSTNNGLIRERYHSFVVSFSLHDWWFIKTKFD